MTRIAICDDHPLVTLGIKTAVMQLPGVEVVGEFNTQDELLAFLSIKECDILILDTRLQGANGFDLLQAAQERSDFKVIFIASEPESTLGVRALRLGAHAYITKHAKAEQITKAVQQAMAGRRFVTPELTAALLESVRVQPLPDNGVVLSGRELQILRMLLGGRKLHGIAQDLMLSPKTVSVYRSRLLEKCGAANNDELAAYAAKHNIK